MCAVHHLGHKGGLLKRTDVHHRLSYNHKFFTSEHACAVQFNHTGSMCPLLGWGAPLSMYITRKIKGCGKRMCAMWLCVWGIPLRVRCPVLQWKHPGLQLRWSQVRIPLPGLPEADQAERQLGQRQDRDLAPRQDRENTYQKKTLRQKKRHRQTKQQDKHTKNKHAISFVCLTVSVCVHMF